MLASTALMGIAAFMFIDNAAHVGGVATGAAMGYVSTLGERTRASRPADLSAVLASLVLVGGAVFTIGRLIRS